MAEVKKEALKVPAFDVTYGDCAWLIFSDEKAARDMLSVLTANHVPFIKTVQSQTGISRIDGKFVIKLNHENYGHFSAIPPQGTWQHDKKRHWASFRDAKAADSFRNHLYKHDIKACFGPFQDKDLLLTFVYTLNDEYRVYYSSENQKKIRDVADYGGKWCSEGTFCWATFGTSEAADKFKTDYHQKGISAIFGPQQLKNQFNKYTYTVPAAAPEYRVYYEPDAIEQYKELTDTAEKLKTREAIFAKFLRKIESHNLKKISSDTARFCETTIASPLKSSQLKVIEICNEGLARKELGFFSRGFRSSEASALLRTIALFPPIVLGVEADLHLSAEELEKKYLPETLTFNDDEFEAEFVQSEQKQVVTEEVTVVQTFAPVMSVPAVFGTNTYQPPVQTMVNPAQQAPFQTGTAFPVAYPQGPAPFVFQQTNPNMFQGQGFAQPPFQPVMGQQPSVVPNSMFSPFPATTVTNQFAPAPNTFPPGGY